MCALAVLLVVRSAAADPLVITAGQFGFLFDGAASVDISGPAFSVGNADSNPEEFGIAGLAIALADPSSAALPLGGHILPNFSGRLTLTDGTANDYYTLQFDLHFTGGFAAAAPVEMGGSCVPWGESCHAVAASGPFRLTGDMMTLGYSNELISRWSLAGTGIATVGFVLPDGQPPRPFAFYRFAPAAAVPEPGTLMLMSVAVIAVMRRSWRV